MSVNDPLPDTGEDVQAHPYVRNAIIALLAVPPLMVLWAIGIAAIGTAYRTALYGQVPDLSGVTGALDSQLVVFAVLGAVGYLYLVWANTVFGSGTIREATEQAKEIKDYAEDQEDEDTEGE